MHVMGKICFVYNLISTVVISGLFVSFLDTIYVLLFGRYIYLYRDYLDYNKLDSENDGNFDDIKKDIKDALDKTDIDDKVIDTVNKISNKVKEKTKSDEKGDDK